jgi:hypothetical protein
MYRPTLYPNGIWVTLGKIPWEWRGDYEDNQLKNPFITPQNIGQESNELPVWNSFFN